MCLVQNVTDVPGCTEMRASMVYVLLNFRKHLRAPAGIDPRSSGPHFGGWQRAPGVTVGPAATAAPTTWMATIGWLRAGGPLKLEEHPSHGPTRFDSANVASAS